jgi:hypothetical protein
LWIERFFGRLFPSHRLPFLSTIGQMAVSLRFPTSGYTEQVAPKEGESSVNVGHALSTLRDRLPELQHAPAQLQPAESLEMVLRTTSKDSGAPSFLREHSHSDSSLSPSTVYDVLLERTEAVHIDAKSPFHWLATFTTPPDLRSAKSAKLERHGTDNAEISITCRYGNENEKDDSKNSKRRRQFIGREEGSAHLHFALVRDGSAQSKALRCDRWLRLSPNVRRKQNDLTLEQAEEMMTKARRGGRKQAERICEVAEKNRVSEMLPQQDAEQLPEQLSDDESESEDEGTDATSTMSAARAASSASAGTMLQHQHYQSNGKSANEKRGRSVDDDDNFWDNEDAEAKEPERGEDWEHGAIAGEASDDEEMELKEGQLKQQEEDEQAGENKAKQGKLQQKLQAQEGEEDDEEEDEGKQQQQQQDIEIKERARQLGIEGVGEEDEDEEEEGDIQDDVLPDANPDQDTELADLLSTTPEQHKSENESSSSQQQGVRKRGRSGQDDGSAPKVKAIKKEQDIKQIDVSAEAVKQLLEERGSMTTKAVKKEFEARGTLPTQAAQEQLKNAIKNGPFCMRNGYDGKRYLAVQQ